MKKKVIEGARKLIKKLFEAILDREAFIFEAPKAFTRNFSRDMLTDDQLEVIDSWKAAVRGQLNTAEKLHADKRGLADHGDTYFEMLPLPAPNIIVMCDKCLIRYEIEVLRTKKESFCRLFRQRSARTAWVSPELTSPERSAPSFRLRVS